MLHWRSWSRNYVTFSRKIFVADEHVQPAVVIENVVYWLKFEKIVTY